MKKAKYLFLSVIPCLTLIGCEKQTFKHAFSVSEDKQIYFAESNLQYHCKNNTWRFAPNSYDFVGDSNANIADNYDGYIDLFTWGATGYATKPDVMIDDNSVCGDGSKDIADTNWDFGKYLGEQLGDSSYRMFTHTEIHYLLMFRKNADKLFGYGTINETRGLFILPDDYANPQGIEFSPSTDHGFSNNYDWYWSNGTLDNYNYNQFSISEWNTLKEAGAVFLPASGMRYVDEVSHSGLTGHYWTSSHYGADFANCLCLFEHDLFLEGNFDRAYGLSVRLVKDAK